MAISHYCRLLMRREFQESLSLSLPPPPFSPPNLLFFLRIGASLLIVDISLVFESAPELCCPFNVTEGHSTLTRPNLINLSMNRCTSICFLASEPIYTNMFLNKSTDIHPNTSLFLAQVLFHH